MTKVINLLILLLLSKLVFGQKKVGSDAVNMNSCGGAINIFEDGDFKLQFTGSTEKNALENYPSLYQDFDSKNTLWCSFIAPVEGDLTLNANVAKGFLQMVVFEEKSGDICGEIGRGKAEIKRLIKSKKHSVIGLDYKVEDHTLYSLSLTEGKKVYIMFATDAEEKKNLFLSWKFVPSTVLEAETKLVDKRDDDFAPTLSLSVRDGESGLPLIAGLVLEGTRELEGLYTGSDFKFSLSRSMKVTVRCDVEGYFYHDSIYEVSGFEDLEIAIPLERISSGKTMNIEEIQFVPGTSEIVKSSEAKLRRLKDFLALNSDINVEIQGHVMALGDNTFAAQRVSEARAKRVMKYLIENGIEKRRLSAVGYGNTRPIYPNPKLFAEEQANRRVEIMVK